MSKYDFDLQEHVITVNDWINETTIGKFTNHTHNDGDNKPHSILINGRGALQKFYDSNGNLIETPRAKFFIKQGKKYRFRLINAGFLYCPIQFSIDNHNLTVIASDGKLVDPVEVDNLIIYAGERYDFILNANRDVDSYLIRTKGYADCGVFKCFQTAILNYEGQNNNLLENKIPQMNLTYENLTVSNLVSFFIFLSF